jgi:hypothetical protein
MMTDDQRELLFDAIREARGEWPENFVRSIFDQSFNPFFTLSAAQLAKLVEITDGSREDYFDQEEIPF